MRQTEVGAMAVDADEAEAEETLIAKTGDTMKTRGEGIILIKSPSSYVMGTRLCTTHRTSSRRTRWNRCIRASVNDYKMNAPNGEKAGDYHPGEITANEKMML